MAHHLRISGNEKSGGHPRTGAVAKKSHKGQHGTAGGHLSAVVGHITWRLLTTIVASA
jgi:hypothetical protein